jgi:hypothetical protein
MAAPDSEQHATDTVFKLIEGVKTAFDRDPDTLKCPENERTRLAEALFPVAGFIHNLLGPSYGNHQVPASKTISEPWQ